MTFFISTEENLQHAQTRFFERLQKCAALATVHFSSTEPHPTGNPFYLDELLRQRSYELPEEDLSKYQLYAFFTVCTPAPQSAVEEIAKSLLMDDDEAVIDQFPSSVDLSRLTAEQVLRGT